MPVSYRQNIPMPNPVPEEESLWNWIEKGMHRTQQYKKKSIYASSAFCSRYNALTLNTEINDASVPSLALYAHLGDCIESFVVDALVIQGKLVSTQYKPKLHEADPAMSLSGKIDIIYRNQHNQLAILEIKSTGQIESKDSLYRKKDGTLGQSTKAGIIKSGPSLSHRTQAAIYAGLTGITDVAILYISRNVIEKFGDGIAHYIYKVDTTEDALTPVFNDLYYADLCNKSKVVPIRPAHFHKSIECKHCELADSCYADESEETEKHQELKLLAQERSAIFMQNIAKRQQMVFDDMKKIETAKAEAKKLEAEVKAKQIAEMVLGV